MTRSDAWRKRKVVLRYFAYKDELRRLGVEVPVPAKVTFHLPMPPSWSKKKRAAQKGAPHLNKPDIDNLLKGLLDAVFDEDCQVWSLWGRKLWSEAAEITIEQLEDKTT